jgi:GNAT superfamily N-acetyltransferase
MTQKYEKMSGYHPNESHWYLPLLGIDPLHHGKGMGSALLQHALAICDQDNKYAILNHQTQGIFPYTNGMDLNYLAQSR